MALRNDPAVKSSTREHVQRVAQEMGYKPNAYVSTLMAQVRANRPISDHGCLAVLVGTSSMKEWHSVITYEQQYAGIASRAESMGYHTECFFLGENYTSSRISHVLRARGVIGVLLAAPQGNVVPAFEWEHFAFSTIAYSWKGPPVHLATSHHRHNVDIAWKELLRRGYRRIGFCLPHMAVEGVDHQWLTGYLYWQWKLPPKQRIPLFVENDHLTGDEIKIPPRAFTRWFKQHTPDAIIGLGELEYQWLQSMGVRVPEDVGVAGINLTRPGISGICESHHAVGSAAVDLLVRQIQNNERGLPECPKYVMIDGIWREGNSLRPAPPAE